MNLRTCRSQQQHTGRHEYRFVVDGEWVDKPAATELIPSAFGATNAVLEVRPAAVNWTTTEMTIAKPIQKNDMLLKTNKNLLVKIITVTQSKWMRPALLNTSLWRELLARKA